jgi:hypothetical protein
LWATAYHEAGHAVVAIHLGIGIGRKGVSIIPDPDANRSGRTHILLGFAGRPDVAITDRMRLCAEKRVVVSFAGQAAQRKFQPRSVRRDHADSDRQGILDLLIRFIPNIPELEAYCRWLEIRAENLVNSPMVWLRICAVAEALVEQKYLRPQEVRAICIKPWTATLKRG